MNRLFNTKFKIVSGYKGRQRHLHRHGTRRGGRPLRHYDDGSRVVRPDWITQKKINFIVQTGLTPGPTKC